MESGVVYTGVLHTATPFGALENPAERFKYVLKAATSSDTTQPTTVVVDMDQVVQLQSKVSTSAAAGRGLFCLDGDIAGRPTTTSHTSNSPLVQADAAWTAPQTTTSNNNNMRLGQSIDGWDQFQANEKLFNVKGGFDESVYTTVLDTSQVSVSDQHRAARLAREIQSAEHDNPHIAEERNQTVATGLDEEDRYSGVLPAPPPPKLNYAQAAGKAEPKSSSPGGEESNEAPPPGSPATSAVEAPIPPEEEEKPKEEEEEASAQPPPPSKSKLNANAKEFSLNGAAMPFVPPPQPHAFLPPQPYAIDPHTHMPVPIIQQIPMQPGTYISYFGSKKWKKVYPQY